MKFKIDGLLIEERPTGQEYYGEYVCVNEKYEVTFVRETYNIYPID